MSLPRNTPLTHEAPRLGELHAWESSALKPGGFSVAYRVPSHIY